MKKIVYVIGAGASKEIRLPLGDELKERIYKLLDFPSSILVTNGFGFYEGEIAFDKDNAAIFRIFMSQTNEYKRLCFFKSASEIIQGLAASTSIDDYLEATKENENGDNLVYCSKLAIISAILNAEKDSCLYVDTNNSYNTLDLKELDKSWYAKFFSTLVQGCDAKDEFKKLRERLNNLTLIIFNYDRCIEQYLYHAFQYRYGISDKESASLISEITIIHPYGDVGKLPFQSPKKDIQTMDYGGEYSSNHLTELTKRIFTFSDRKKEDDEIKKMRKNFFNADKIIFLGFAFHEQNLKLFKSDRHQNISSVKPECFLNVFGVSRSNQEVIKSDLADITSNHCPKNSHDEKCEEFFNEFSRLLRFD
jgi:hypothetical protein